MQRREDIGKYWIVLDIDSHFESILNIKFHIVVLN